MKLNKSKKHSFFIICLSLFSTAKADMSKVEYDFIHKDIEIGTIEIKRQRTGRNDKTVITYDAHMSLLVNASGDDYSLEAKEHVVVGKQGVLHYIAEYNDNGKKSRVEGHLDDYKFLGTVQDGEEHHTFLFPVLGFDPIAFTITTQLNNNDLSLVSNFMNPQTMEFEEETRTFAGEKLMKLANKTYLCRIINFESSLSHGRRWIAKDVLGQFLVKETGQDSDGKYSIIMIEHNTDSEQ